MASLVGLHVTESVSVHLAVLARSGTKALTDVDDSLHERHRVVRWTGTRRRPFVLPRDPVQVVRQQPDARSLRRCAAAPLRQQLIRRLELNGAKPAWFRRNDSITIPLQHELLSRAEPSRAEPGRATHRP